MSVCGFTICIPPCSGKDEAEGDIQDLVISFTGLEEKVLEQYTVAKVLLMNISDVSRETIEFSDQLGVRLFRPI